MSIRGRLLIAALALVAIGLLVANGATYALLRSSLIHRLDQQLKGAQEYAVRSLIDSVERGRFPSFSDPGRRRGEPQPPAATFGQLRDPAGDVVLTQSFGFGDVKTLPALPPTLPGSNGTASDLDTIFTTRAPGVGGYRYRVLASAIPGGGTVVVGMPMVDVDLTLRRLLVVEGLVTGSVLLATAVLAHWLVGLGLKPLEQMGAAADAIAGGDLSRRVEPSDDRTEVGRLGFALNAMLGRIESAFEAKQTSEARLRRFVADASHELRTPLTSIRGYAELFRRGADVRPEDLAKSMRRIEEESERMGALVDELLLLARLDQGRPLEKAPVDLAVVARDAVEDARLIGPRHRFDLVSTETAIVQGDEARLRQVLSNLVNNAVVHTPTGTVVRVLVERIGSEVVVAVDDSGPGMTAEDAARAFDRFFRVDAARSRQRGGAGLGLSIASAIVEAHGGHLSLETSPGAGARFIARFPA